MTCRNTVPVLTRNDTVHIADLSCGALYNGAVLLCQECQDAKDADQYVYSYEAAMYRAYAD